MEERVVDELPEGQEPARQLDGSEDHGEPPCVRYRGAALNRDTFTPPAGRYPAPVAMAYRGATEVDA